MRIFSLRKVWNSWTLFDSEGVWVRSDEMGSRWGFRMTHCTSAIDSGTASARNLSEDDIAISGEHSLDLSGVRIKRVARIRAAIANGSYRVSAADLAQKLVGQSIKGWAPFRGQGESR